MRRLATFASLSACFLVAAVLLASHPLPLGAQGTGADRIRQQRDELERIRRERAELQRRMQELQSNVHDLSAEVTNLDQQADATARAVRSLDAQLASITDEVDSSSARMVRAEDELSLKRAVLQRRLADIYKRGPLYTFEAMLSAESFGALVARYKYLHLLALRDRALVTRVEVLRNQVRRQRRNLVTLQDELELNRREKTNEEQRLRELEEQRGRSLEQAKAQQKQIERRLAEIERTEARVASTIETLEAARRRAESRPFSRAPAASSLRTTDLGRLDWPVDGTILYRFGRVVNPNNTTTRWNGIGIAAPQGTPVKAISDGEVAVAEPIGTYGLTVIVQHGAGDYSVYGSLSSTGVRRGQKVRKGQVIGFVGSSDPELAPHLHFEIRRDRGRAVDPLEWLREQR